MRAEVDDDDDDDRRCEENEAHSGLAEFGRMRQIAVDDSWSPNESAAAISDDDGTGRFVTEDEEERARAAAAQSAINCGRGETNAAKLSIAAMHNGCNQTRPRRRIRSLSLFAITANRQSSFRY